MPVNVFSLFIIIAICGGTEDSAHKKSVYDYNKVSKTNS